MTTTTYLPSRVIGMWPTHTLYQIPCRHCGELFKQVVPNQRYCTKPACVEWRKRREHERARGRR